MRWVFDHLALELETPGAGWLAAMAGPAQLASLIAVAILAFRGATTTPFDGRRRRRWGSFSSARSSRRSISCGSCRSPSRSRAAWAGGFGRLFLASCLLTTWMYPWGVRLPIVVYNLRNLTLLVIWFLMLSGGTENPAEISDLDRDPSSRL